jgi:hypothetical protein
MQRIRSAAHLVVEHWLLVLAVVANLAIAAAPVDAVRYKNDICTNGQGEWEACCTTCWFFCDCDFGGGGGPPPPPAP